MTSDELWKKITEMEGKAFKTFSGLEFTYTVKGGEIFVSRKDKSITRSSVEKAYDKAKESDWVVSGPKKLGTFGASYLYPIFIAAGLIKKEKIEKESVK